MQQSKFLDPSIGLHESVAFNYGLPWVVSLLCELAPKNLKYAKVGWFWCSLAQADPTGDSDQLIFERDPPCFSLTPASE